MEAPSESAAKPSAPCLGIVGAIAHPDAGLNTLLLGPHDVPGQFINEIRQLPFALSAQ